MVIGEAKEEERDREEDVRTREDKVEPYCITNNLKLFTFPICKSSKTRLTWRVLSRFRRAQSRLVGLGS